MHKGSNIFIKKFDESVDRFKLNPEEVLDGKFYGLAEIEGLDSKLLHPQLVPCLEKTSRFILSGGAEAVIDFEFCTDFRSNCLQ